MTESVSAPLAVKMSETLYGSYSEEILSLICDLFIFLCKSIFYILEAVYFSVIPDKFRKLKVSIHFEAKNGRCLKCITILNSVLAGSSNLQ